MNIKYLIFLLAFLHRSGKLIPVLTKYDYNNKVTAVILLFEDYSWRDSVLTKSIFIISEMKIILYKEYEIYIKHSVMLSKFLFAFTLKHMWTHMNKLLN